VGGVLPTGISGFPGTFGLGQFGGFGGLGGWGGHGGWTTHGWPSHGQYKGPIYVINKKSDYFSWLIPLLLLLGAPLLFGLALIPLALKSIIYILQICRNLGKFSSITKLKVKQSFFFQKFFIYLFRTFTSVNSNYD
jgi:hypothetical protein